MKRKPNKARVALVKFFRFVQSFFHRKLPSSITITTELDPDVVRDGGGFPTMGKVIVEVEPLFRAMGKVEYRFRLKHEQGGVIVDEKECILWVGDTYRLTHQYTLAWDQAWGITGE